MKLGPVLGRSERHPLQQSLAFCPDLLVDFISLSVRFCCGSALRLTGAIMSRTSKAGIDPDGEEREGRMPMQLADFPRWLRALFAVFLILFFFNALYALAFFTA